MGKEKADGNDANSFNPTDGDEALRLIGVERTTEFTEEYNRKLRRKLVHSQFDCFRNMLTILLRSGSADSAYMCCRIFHTVSVSHQN